MLQDIGHVKASNNGVYCKDFLPLIINMFEKFVNFFMKKPIEI